MISECPLEILDFPKIPRKLWQISALESKKWSNQKDSYFIVLNSPQWKFIYSEKVTKFWEISTIDLTYEVPVKSTVEILQNFVTFSEYINFTNTSDPQVTYCVNSILVMPIKLPWDIDPKSGTWGNKFNNSLHASSALQKRQKLFWFIDISGQIGDASACIALGGMHTLGGFLGFVFGTQKVVKMGRSLIISSFIFNHCC